MIHLWENEGKVKLLKFINGDDLLLLHVFAVVDVICDRKWFPWEIFTVRRFRRSNNNELFSTGDECGRK